MVGQYVKTGTIRSVSGVCEHTSPAIKFNTVIPHTSIPFYKQLSINKLLATICHWRKKCLNQKINRVNALIHAADMVIVKPVLSIIKKTGHLQIAARAAKRKTENPVPKNFNIFPFGENGSCYIVEH
jgi:hypothetical protein